MDGALRAGAVDRCMACCRSSLDLGSWCVELGSLGSAGPEVNGALKEQSSASLMGGW